LKRIKKMICILLILLTIPIPTFAKSGVPFNPITDIDWGEIDITIEGPCICIKKWKIKIGIIISYWEPFMLADTVSESNYSPMIGMSVGPNILPGSNQSADNNVSESTFAQAHGFLLPLFPFVCRRRDYGAWWSEFDPTWQSDELSAIITPEAGLYANKAMQMSCMADATAVGVGWPLDVMPWCVGSGGTVYPLTGHVDNDNIIQANSTVAARLIFKLNRMFMICDPSPKCGCMFTPVWIKSHYKLAAVRPGVRDVYPVGKSAKFYDSALNPPFAGAMGSNDEFLWVVYRKQRCCTCCEKK